MALLVLCLCREPFGFASHSRGDPLITNDVLYHLSYSGLQALIWPCSSCLNAPVDWCGISSSLGFLQSSEVVYPIEFSGVTGHRLVIQILQCKIGS